jgi:diazepam-binding inhibitor (GABA receptor modulating acyl-CoA-binding protein)
MSESDFAEAARFLTSPAARALKVDTATKLKLYGLFKQATVGPNGTAKPSFLNLTESAKWKAWTLCGQMSAADARKAYLEVVTTLRGKSKL